MSDDKVPMVSLDLELGDGLELRARHLFDQFIQNTDSLLTGCDRQQVVWYAAYRNPEGDEMSDENESNVDESPQPETPTGQKTEHICGDGNEVKLASGVNCDKCNWEPPE